MPFQAAEASTLKPQTPAPQSPWLLRGLAYVEAHGTYSPLFAVLRPVLFNHICALKRLVTRQCCGKNRLILSPGQHLASSGHSPGNFGLGFRV